MTPLGPKWRLDWDLMRKVIAYIGREASRQEETKALVSVSGPMDVRLAAEQASKATFEVVVRPLAGLPGEH